MSRPPTSHEWRWNQGENINSEERWLAPWTVMDGRSLSIYQEKILDTYASYINARRDN